MLTANKELIDLGTIQFGKVYNFECEITNTLDKDMVIDKIRTSCSSCTKATLAKKIKGKSSEVLKVTFTPGVTGNTSKYVDILYDNDQVLRVNFKASVDA